MLHNDIISHFTPALQQGLIISLFSRFRRAQYTADLPRPAIYLTTISPGRYHRRAFSPPLLATDWARRVRSDAD